MRVRVITPPDPVVTWEDADAQMKLSGDESDKPYVEGLIAAATAHIDGPDGWLGRALGLQTLEARFCGYDVGRYVRLPYPPFVQLMSVSYLDASGATLPVALDELDSFGADLAPLSGSWPWAGAALRREAVRVQYVAGYQGDIPAPVRVAILMMVADMYRNRVTTQAGAQSVVPMSTKVEDLLSTFRVYR